MSAELITEMGFLFLSDTEALSAGKIQNSDTHVNWKEFEEVFLTAQHILLVLKLYRKNKGDKSQFLFLSIY